MRRIFCLTLGSKDARHGAYLKYVSTEQTLLTTCEAKKTSITYFCLIAACAAASLAIGTRNGEQDTY